MTGAHIGFLTGSIGFLAGLGAKIWIDYLLVRKPIGSYPHVREEK